MARERKDSTPITVRMDTPTFERLEDYCRLSGQTKTIAIERAVNQFIDEYEEQIQKLERLK